MDTLTHIVIGACAGEATTGKRLGQKALWLGAIAQSLPDIDFVTHFWLEQPDEIIAHRGLTHSILFAFLSTILLAWICRYVFHAHELSWKRWILLFGVNLFSHIFLDSFNAYGTGWFEPFNHSRISFNVIYVADPFFSIWPFLAFLGLLIIRRDQHKRKIIWMAGIGFAFAYLIYAIVNKSIVEQVVRKNMRDMNIPVLSSNYFTTPTPLNSLLWYVVIKDKNGFYINYRSVNDREENIPYEYFPRNDSLAESVIDKEELNKLIAFAQGYYTIENRNDSLLLNVIRFGQVAGWYYPKEKFAFYYLLDRPGENELVVQRGRFQKWNAATFHSFIARIRGK